MNQVYNIALGDRTSLNYIRKRTAANLALLCQLPASKLSYRDFPAGDLRHSLVDISKARILLGYAPTINAAADVVVAVTCRVSKVDKK